MATTDRFGWPIPDDTDRVSAGAAAMRGLAEGIEGDVRRQHIPAALNFAQTGSPTGALTVQVPPEVLAWGRGFIVIPTARHSSGMWVASMVSRTGTEYRVAINQVNGAGATTNVAVDLVIMEV